jgi:hypothetical protein
MAFLGQTGSHKASSSGVLVDAQPLVLLVLSRVAAKKALYARPKMVWPNPCKHTPQAPRLRVGNQGTIRAKSIDGGRKTSQSNGFHGRRIQKVAKGRGKKIIGDAAIAQCSDVR